jgi:hypothetical protein
MSRHEKFKLTHSIWLVTTMTDPCNHPVILIHPLPVSLTLPKPGNMLFRGTQRTIPSHISELVQPESHILQACYNHNRPVHTGLFFTWCNSYIRTWLLEPRRIIIPSIFWILFWKEKHVSHITQFLQTDLTLLVKAFSVSTNVFCQGKSIIDQYTGIFNYARKS